MPHTKPSKAELQASIDAANAELETPPTEEVAPVEPIAPAPVEPVIEPVQTEETPPTEEVAPVEPIAPAPVTSEGEENNEPDYKKKFADSTRAAQSEAAKRKALNQAIQDAAGAPEPTPEELKTEYPEWEDMTATEQRLAKDNLFNKKKFSFIEAATAKGRKTEEWVGRLNSFVENPKTLANHPELEGITDEFLAFAQAKPGRSNIEFDDLVLAFSGERAKHPPAPKKGQMFETGTGGNKDPVKPKDTKFTAEENAAIMKVDYKRGLQNLKDGKVNLDATS